MKDMGWEYASALCSQQSEMTINHLEHIKPNLHSNFFLFCILRNEYFVNGHTHIDTHFINRQISLPQ